MRQSNEKNKEVMRLVSVCEPWLPVLRWESKSWKRGRIYDFFFHVALRQKESAADTSEDSQ